MAKSGNNHGDAGKTKPIQSSVLSAKSKAKARRVSRGVALFLGAFALVNALAGLVSKCPGLSIWWLDFSGLEALIGRWGRAVTLALEALTGGLLVAWGVRPETRMWRRIATAGFSACLALVALRSALGFWRGLAEGSMSALVPIPASLVLCLAFAVVCVRVWTAHGSFERGYGSHGIVGAVLVAAVCAFAFPLLQVFTFGTTDYRANADCVAVPGARLEADGGMSAVLRARVDSAVELVQGEGATTLVLSGGTEESGANEASAMAEYARGKLGESGVSIVEDQQGTSLVGSVKDTVSLLGDADTVLVTSSFYQLPRLKMLYLAADQDVRTVPVVDLALEGTPEALLREVGAWWACWFSCYL